MKQLTLTLLLVSLYAGVSAQYKKASFFQKEGRTYGLGARTYALGDGKGSPVGFYAAFGRDQDSKRLFTFWELQFIPGYEFSVNVFDENDAPQTVTGKSKVQLIYGYNWGYHLIKGEGETPKIQPYLTAGFNIGILGGVQEISDNSYNTKPTVADRSFSCGIGGGAGVVWNINSWFGLQVQGGYTLQGNLEIQGQSEGGKAYHMFTKHPYASAGVRFRVSKDN
jgi:hypothetical protein